MKHAVARCRERCGHEFDAACRPSARSNGGRGGTIPMSQTQSESTGATGQHICPRCNGLMVPGCIDGLLPEILDEGILLSRRCVNCGEWIDSTVMANRRAGPEGTVAVTRLTPVTAQVTRHNRPAEAPEKGRRS